MINELNIIENINLLFESRIILYGAGNIGKETYSLLKYAGVEVSYFCDSNSSKWCEVLYGIEIISPERLKEIDLKEEILIVISAQETYALEIMKFLESLPLTTSNVLTLLGLEILFAQNANNERITKKYRDYIFKTEKWKRDLLTLRAKSMYLSYLNYPFKSTELLVYQPAKVGSISIHNSLNAVGIGNLHTHLLVVPPLHYDFVALLKTILNEMNRDGNIKIITLVREPIARGFSAHFHLLGEYGPYLSMSAGDSFMDACCKTLGANRFRLSDGSTCYGYQFDWFDKELKTAFGVDVFQYPFDKEAGYSIIKKENVDLLVMKLEKLNSLESVVGQFVGTPQFKLINENEGSKKIYKYLYHNVREVIKIPREIIDLYYKGNPRMDHFYTEEEKADFLKKWENNISD